MTENTIAVLDIEATNFRKKGGLIVEIWIAALDLKTWVIKNIIDTLIQEPGFDETHYTWEFGRVFKNSDLEPEMIYQAPTLEHKREEIQECLDNSYWVTAFNTAFDFPLMEDRGFTIHNKLPCLMHKASKPMKIWLKEKAKKKRAIASFQQAWNYYLNTPYVEKHRGADDAYHETILLRKLIELGLYSIDQ